MVHASLWKNLYRCEFLPISYEGSSSYDLFYGWGVCLSSDRPSGLCHLAPVGGATFDLLRLGVPTLLEILLRVGMLVALTMFPCIL